jgi:hypothetical protein
VRTRKKGRDRRPEEAPCCFAPAPATWRDLPKNTRIRPNPLTYKTIVHSHSVMISVRSTMPRPSPFHIPDSRSPITGYQSFQTPVSLSLQTLPARVLSDLASICMVVQALVTLPQTPIPKEPLSLPIPSRLPHLSAPSLPTSVLGGEYTHSRAPPLSPGQVKRVPSKRSHSTRSCVCVRACRCIVERV